jgi:hypothetical protein
MPIRNLRKLADFARLPGVFDEDSRVTDLSKFRELGYQVIANVIPAELVADIQHFLGEHVDKMLDTLSKFGVTSDINTAGGQIAATLRNTSSLSDDLKVLMTGHFPLEVRLDKKLLSIPKDGRVRGLLESIHETKSLRMHMPPMARYIMPGNTEAGVPPHQDVSYNGHMDNFITMWVPLVPVDAKCGGVTAYPGGPKRKIEVVKRVENGVWIEGIPTEGLHAENCVPMNPGDVLVFDRFLVHGSMPNTSDRIRFSLDYRFFPASSPSSKHYLDMNSWEVFQPESVHA